MKNLEQQECIISVLFLFFICFWAEKFLKIKEEKYCVQLSYIPIFKVIRNCSQKKALTFSVLSRVMWSKNDLINIFKNYNETKIDTSSIKILFDQTHAIFALSALLNNNQALFHYLLRRIMCLLNYKV